MGRIGLSWLRNKSNCEQNLRVCPAPPSGYSCIRQPIAAFGYRRDYRNPEDWWFAPPPGTCRSIEVSARGYFWRTTNPSCEQPQVELRRLIPTTALINFLPVPQDQADIRAWAKTECGTFVWSAPDGNAVKSKNSIVTKPGAQACDG